MNSFSLVLLWMGWAKRYTILLQMFEKIKEGKDGFGFNVVTGCYEDLFASGIIDPSLVVCTAIQNAASVAGLMLTTNVVITDLHDDDDPIDQAIF